MHINLKQVSYLLSATSASASGLLAKLKASLRSLGLRPRCWLGKALVGKELVEKVEWEGKEVKLFIFPAGK